MRVPRRRVKAAPSRSAKRRAPDAGIEREFERQGPLEPGEAVVDIGCPDCRGVLAARELGEHHWLSFRCRIGHAFGADSLIVAKTAQIEQSLDSALAALGELADVYAALEVRLRAGAARSGGVHFGREARDARRRIAVIRGLLNRGPKRVEASDDGE
jgi:two-component system, chemotaxis family, protein-glutamate methylesterase/glutaminase